jgi:hypothetical protein
MFVLTDLVQRALGCETARRVDPCLFPPCPAIGNVSASHMELQSRLENGEFSKKKSKTCLKKA